jgi:hypothetical protein
LNNRAAWFYFLSGLDSSISFTTGGLLFAAPDGFFAAVVVFASAACKEAVLLTVVFVLAGCVVFFLPGIYKVLFFDGIVMGSVAIPVARIGRRSCWRLVFTCPAGGYIVLCIGAGA